MIPDRYQHDLGQLNHHASSSSLILQLACARMRRIAKPQSQDEPSIAVFSASDHTGRVSVVPRYLLDQMYLRRSMSHGFTRVTVPSILMSTLRINRINQHLMIIYHFPIFANLCRLTPAHTVPTHQSPTNHHYCCHSPHKRPVAQCGTPLRRIQITFHLQRGVDENRTKEHKNGCVAPTLFVSRRFTCARFAKGVSMILRNCDYLTDTVVYWWALAVGNRWLVMRQCD